MPEKKSRKKLAAHTAESLTTPPPVTDNPREDVLAKLLELALGGNVAAAKLYLDCTAGESSHDDSALSADEALKLIREHISNS